MNWMTKEPNGIKATSRAEARCRGLKVYEGRECPYHRGEFTRYAANCACVLCAQLAMPKGKRAGYVAKNKDKLAFRHPVSPWPITAENMHLCPDLTFWRA